MINGENIAKIDLYVMDQRTNLPSERRVFGFTTDKVQ